MAVSFTTIGFAGVIVAGLTFGLIGRQEAPAATPVAAMGGGALTSVSFELPTSDRVFPPGPGVDVVAANCVTCHSAGMVLNQPRMPKAAWAAEVAKMKGAFKAPLDEKDVPAIVGYLAAIKGTK